MLPAGTWPAPGDFEFPGHVEQGARACAVRGVSAGAGQQPDTGQQAAAARGHHSNTRHLQKAKVCAALLKAVL